MFTFSNAVTIMDMSSCRWRRGKNAGNHSNVESKTSLDNNESREGNQMCNKRCVIKFIVLLPQSNCWDIFILCAQQFENVRKCILREPLFCLKRCKLSPIWIESLSLSCILLIDSLESVRATCFKKLCQTKGCKISEENSEQNLLSERRKCALRAG